MKRVLRILLILLLALLLLVGVVLFVLLTPSGQEIVTTQANRYLKNKLQTKIEIGHIRLQWPTSVGIENLYIEDQKGDTLVAAVKLKAGINMWGLLRGRIAIGEVVLEKVRGNVARKAPDKAFNYQFIIDAFSSNEPSPQPEQSAPLTMSWDKLTLREVHLTYYDDASGVDTDVKLPDAQVAFSAFNPSYSRYHPTGIYLKNAALSLNLFEAVDLDLPEEVVAASTDTLDLELGVIDFQDVSVTYRDEVSGMKASIALPKLLTNIDYVYLDGQRVGVNELVIDGAKTFVLFEEKENAPVSAANITEATGDTTGGWQIALANLELIDSEVKYDDENEKPLRKGVDFSHLHIRGLDGKLTGFSFSEKETFGKLERLTFSEKSGLTLDALSSEFAYTDRQAFLKNLRIETPYTSLGDHLLLQYENPSQLTEDLGKVGLELNLINSRLGFQDVLLLSPELAENPLFKNKSNGLITGTARLTGTVDDLQIKEAVFTMPEATKMAVTGAVKGLPDPSKIALDLTVDELSSSRSDLLGILPPGTLPDSLELPETLMVRAHLSGTLDALKASADLATDRGNLGLVGDFYNMTDSLNASYNGTLTMERVELGRLLMQPAEQLGALSLSANFSGVGLTPMRAKATVDGTIQQAELLGYSYNNLIVSGNLEEGKATFKAKMDDPNAAIALQGNADLTNEYPSAKLVADIQNIDLKKLNLYTDTLSFSGRFVVDFETTDPANPLGVVSGTDIIVKDKNNSIPVGSMTVEMANEGQEKRLRLESPFANATLAGAFDYSEIGTILTAETARYFNLTDSLAVIPKQPYWIDLSGGVRHHEVLQVFMPGLTKMDPISFSANVSSESDGKVALKASAPLVVYDSTRISGISLTGEGDGQLFDYRGKIDELVSGGFRVRNFTVEGDVANDQARARLTVKDSTDRTQHYLGASVRKDDEDFVVALQRNILLNYVPWRSDTLGSIRYGKDGLLVKDFAVFRNRSREKLLVNSVGDGEGEAPYPNGPIRITADSISIGPLVEMVTRDPKLVAGRLDGDINLRDYMGEAPVFEGDVSIGNLRIQEVDLGDYKLEANNRQADVIDLIMTLKGQHNDIGLSGKYASGSENPLDFQLEMKRLDAGLIEAFSFGELRNGKGSLTGALTIDGSTTSPRLDGQIDFKELAFHVKQMGARYALKDGGIAFNAPKMHLDKLTLLDSLGQELTIDGTISLDNIPDLGYDLKVATNRFMLLNAARKDNDLVYGKVFASANLSVKGRGAENIVDGAVKILKGSDATLILPDDNSGMDRGDGIVEFVKRREEEQQPEEKEAGGVVVDFASELSLNIETDPDAEFTIVLDEMNGDNLRVRGNANLNTGLAPNGQLYLLGSYELEEGAYELTFEILKKQFEIRKGSQLIWSGDPMQAELDITAVYEVQADPSAFSPTHYNYGKVPFNVLLQISGNLSNPKIAFDLEVDERAGSALRNKIDEEQILSSFRSDPSEMNKQVFGLLLLNKFMAETSNVSFGGFNAEAIARQSVSKMLTEQLNNLASDLIKGVQLDFNLNSTAGSAGGRTDLNVGLTKGFLNDRVTVSVGRNFELENSGESAQSSEIFDNIAVNYKVTRDGRYLLRAYRKNQFQTVLEGFIIETGVSFIVTLDYNAVKEFFE